MQVTVFSAPSAGRFGRGFAGAGGGVDHDRRRGGRRAGAVEPVRLGRRRSREAPRDGATVLDLLGTGAVPTAPVVAGERPVAGPEATGCRERITHAIVPTPGLEAA